jgi:argonaute-like protein implicated in RNA metabolism and viral defense
MDQNKPLIEFLEQNNVDHKRPTAVINFYQARRQATMEVILKMFKSVEHEIEKKTGRPFNINMLKPYSKLDDLPPVMKRDDVKELMQGEFYAGTQVPGGQ